MSAAAWLGEFGARYGRALHALVGFAVTVVNLLLAVVAGVPVTQSWYPVVVTLFAVLWIALAHEQAPSGNGPRGDLPWSDFLRINGGPWNGIWDVLAFLPAPIVWLLLWQALHHPLPPMLCLCRPLL